MSKDPVYTLIYDPSPSGHYSTAEFQKALEKGKDAEKIDTMKKILVTMLEGNPLPDLLMHVIRFVMPSKDKELKKLLYFYWEIVPKLDESGKLRQEMILVCNAIQHDLQHPNEFIRGNTLRFLTKLNEPELLETLVPHVRQCLDHRHAYVRKNAIWAIYSIYKVSEHLIPDAAEVLSEVLALETDPICKRNAFIGLGDLDRNAAVGFLQQQPIATMDSLLQLAIIEFISKEVQPPYEYIEILLELLHATPVVVYEACNALAQLTSQASVVASVGLKFVELAVKESDNNVKLVVLDRIADLNKRFPGVLDELTLDILRVLPAQDLDVKQRALDIALDLVSSRNVDDVVKLLKKELSNPDKEYRAILIGAIHKIAIRFVEVAANVVSLLLDFITELPTNAAADVISFTKEVLEKYPSLKPTILNKLTETMLHVKSGKVYRGCLWVLGEYAVESADIQTAWRHLRASIGELPISKKTSETATPVETTGGAPVVLPDGTYATESAMTTVVVEEEIVAPLRHFVLTEDFYTASVLASTIVKLVFRYKKHGEAHIINAMTAEGLLMLVSILRLKPDEDSRERILSAVTYLMDDTNTELMDLSYLDATKKAFKKQLSLKDRKQKLKSAREIASSATPIDKAVAFRQFAEVAPAVQETTEVIVEEGPSKLKKIVQLTGFSDPVYVEAYVTVHQFDIVLDVLLVNQTQQTLKNLQIEFATLGELKVIDKPAQVNVIPHGFHKLSTTVKVKSADMGVIFGNVVYDGGHGMDSKIVILNDVNVNVIDYIKPATTSEENFRTMWNAFEWENKITVKSSLPLQEYFAALLKATNMATLTPVDENDTRFLSANLYSRSSFGEDALANVCIEKDPVSGDIKGHVRVRSKGQGLALSLGDNIVQMAKQAQKVVVAHV